MRSHRPNVLYSERFMGYALLAPLAIYFLVFQLGPMLIAFGVSFTDWNLRSTPEFVGLKHYIELLTDSTKYPLFWSSLWVTFKYVAMSLPLAVFLSLALAAMLNANVKGEGFFKIAYYIPNVTAGAAIAAIWYFLLDPRFGLINTATGLNISWLDDSRFALPSLAAMGIWTAIGYNVLILVSAMKNIPEDLYEAAKVDGATFLQQFFRITLPMTMPAIFFLVVTGLIGGFQVFDQMYMMTKGGPSGSTTTYMYSLFDHAFKYYEIGTASAMSYLLLVLILFVTWLNFKFIPQSYDE